ncbi:MAG: SocA family protein [Bacteroidales bacterium]
MEASYECRIKGNDISKLTAADISKIKAVVLYILKLSGGEETCLSLFWKMYFIQKDSLVRYGKPLFNDSFHSAKLGPFPAFTGEALFCALHEFRDATDEMKRFDSSFTITSKGDFCVWSDEEPDMNEFSEKEIGIMNSVLAKYEKQTPEQRREGACDEAWKKAQTWSFFGPNDAIISFADIARAGGASKEMIIYICRNETLETFYCN